MPDDHFNVLPPGYQLHWYRLERVLGQGGFGITYLAHDTNLDRQVAIKEYLPVEFAARASDHTVQPRSQKYGEDYAWGRDRFVSEAQTLAQFDHPNIVRAYSVFEHNNTAYMVMCYEEGQSLQALLDRSKTLSEGALTAIVLPIVDGLQAIHAAGFIHRDIKPDNILIREDGSPVLLDFGSARRIVGKTHTLTILMSPGYAPFEQYHAGDEQGPWTDIYSLAATLYHGVTGKPPVDAIARSKGALGSTKDILVPAMKIGRGRYSQQFLQAIDHGLAFDGKDRPQTLPIWKEELCGGRVLATFARRVRRSVSTRAAGVATSFVLLSLLGLLLWERMGETVSPASALPGQQTINDERLVALEQQLTAMEKQLEEKREASQTVLRREQQAETQRVAALQQQLAAMEKQLAEQREASETISGQDQQRRAALQERLAALGKELEEQKRSEAELVAREKKLREERERFEQERKRWLEDKHTAEEQRRKNIVAAKRADPITVRSVPYKIALFPFAGQFGGNSNWHREYKVAELLQVRIQQDPSLELAYSYYDDALNYPQMGEGDRDRPWRGEEPNIDLVYEMGLQRNVDAVVMAWGDYIHSMGLRGVDVDMRIYVIDVAQRKVYFEKGTTEAGSVRQKADTLLSLFLKTHPKVMAKTP